jgi:DNA polymerase-3 subunit gamma/tau
MAGNYIVSALKYRPQTFDTVVGQQHITQTLKNAMKTDHLAHSFLFCGPRGVGKTTCARILAKTINCLTPTADMEACDTCENCNAFKSNTSFNVFELDAASNNSVDDIRDLIDQVRFAPAGNSKYKVYIIDEVHMLSSQAFNAFLKTLEEPPSYAIFILATTEKHKILPTILSRCQIFEFKRIVTKDCIDHLRNICIQEEIQADDDALHIISQKSEGCMRDALSIMDKISSFSNGQITYSNTVENLNILDYDYFFKMTDAIGSEDLSNALIMYDEILAKGFEGDTFLSGMAEHFRNLLLSKDAQVAKLMDVADGIKRRYYDQGNALEKSFVLNAITIFNAAEIGYASARNKRLHVEIAIIKLCHVSHAVKVISDTDGNIHLKKMSNNSIVPLRKKKDAATLIVEMPRVTAGMPVAKSNIVNKPSGVPEITSPKVGNILNKEAIRLQAMSTISEYRQKNAIQVTDENLKAAWELYAQDVVRDQDFYLTAFKRCIVSVKEDVITIMCADNFSHEYLSKNKISCATWIKKYYNNLELNLEILRKDNDEEPMEYKSQREIYDEALKKYPKLKEFQRKLGLDFDTI